MKLGVLCYIENDKNEILMLHRIKKENDIHDGKWVAPGGKIEYNETPLAAVKREVFEETGIMIENPIFRGILTFPEQKNNSPFGDLWYVFVYYCKIFDKIKTIESIEGNLSWIKKEEISKLNIWEGDKIFTDYVFKEDINFDICLYYEDDTLISTEINIMPIK